MISFANFVTAKGNSRIAKEQRRIDLPQIGEKLDGATCHELDR